MIYYLAVHFVSALPEKDLDGGERRVSEEGTINQEARRLKLTDLPQEQAERSLL